MNYELLKYMQKKVAYVPPLEMQEQIDQQEKQQQMQQEMEPPPDIRGMAEQEVENLKREMATPPEERLLRLEKQVDILTNFMQELLMQSQQEQLATKVGSDKLYHQATLEGLRYV
jgi:hypothetical protein